MTTPIDWTKPLQTRDGRPVRALCTDSKGAFPVVALIARNAIATSRPT